MYHEATISNLFEVFLYYDYACQAMGDALIDLVDWCVRKITALVARSYGPDPHGSSRTVEQLGAMSPEAAVKAGLSETPSQAIDRHRSEIRFKVGVVAVTMLRYLTEHITKVPLGVMTRILDTHGEAVELVLRRRYCWPVGGHHALNGVIVRCRAFSRRPDAVGALD